MPQEHPVEKLVKIITHKKIEFEIVQRPDVLWVGCVDYAGNNTDESDIQSTLERFQGLVGEVSNEERQLMRPDWSAALSINYCRGDKPCGILFGNETWSDKQDGRFDVFTQPGGLWLRVRDSKRAARRLLGKRKLDGTYEYFTALRAAAQANGYMQNPEVFVEIEYHCHAEYGKKNHTNVAYIAVIEQEAV